MLDSVETVHGVHDTRYTVHGVLMVSGPLSLIQMHAHYYKGKESRGLESLEKIVTAGKIEFFIPI